MLLGLIHSTVKDAGTLWLRMVERRIAEADAQHYFQSVFGGQEIGETLEQPVRRVKGLKLYAMENFESEANRQLGIQGTLWAAYNAAVWAVDQQFPES
jgi:hypothetical protein